jgi:hypothetical protein
MPFRFPVQMADGSTYFVTRLLAKGKSNAKTAKSDKAGLGFLTTSLSLAPAKASGFQLCASASKACIAGCLFTAGRAMIHPRQILPARIAKARMLRLHKREFHDRLMMELASEQRKADKLGLTLAVRLNIVSDVIWEKESPGLFTTFPNAQFYDYTKHFERMMRWTRGELPANYHLTFSWSGTNRAECLHVLASGGNVAVPFHVKYRGDKRQPLPTTWEGYPIIDGDVG